jgi:hypothetical protein
VHRGDVDDVEENSGLEPVHEVADNCGGVGGKSILCIYDRCGSVDVPVALRVKV